MTLKNTAGKGWEQRGAGPPALQVEWEDDSHLTGSQEMEALEMRDEGDRPKGE